MPHALTTLAREHVASIRDVQKNPSRALCGITRVVRGSKTIGFFLANEEWDELLEDIEAFGSASLKASIARALHEKKTGKTISLQAVAKQYGVHV